MMDSGCTHPCAVGALEVCCGGGRGGCPVTFLPHLLQSLMPSFPAVVAGGCGEHSPTCPVLGTVCMHRDRDSVQSFSFTLTVTHMPPQKKDTFSIILHFSVKLGHHVPEWFTHQCLIGLCLVVLFLHALLPDGVWACWREGACNICHWCKNLCNIHCPQLFKIILPLNPPSDLCLFVSLLNV